MCPPSNAPVVPLVFRHFRLLSGQPVDVAVPADASDVASARVEVGRALGVPPSRVRLIAATGLELADKESIALVPGDVTVCVSPPRPLAPSDVTIDDSVSGLLNGAHYGCRSSSKVRRGALVSASVAVKVMKHDDAKTRQRLLNDVMALATGEQSRYLVTWYGGFVQGAAVHGVMELMDFGSLLDVKSTARGSGMPAPELACALLQVVRGLDFLHVRGGMHGNLKSANVLCNRRGDVKIADFGLSPDYKEEMLQWAINSMPVMYESPEQCTGESAQPASDIWSLGIIVVELATGIHPHEHLDSFPALWQAMMEEPEPRLAVESHCPKLCAFVAGCLVRDVPRRFCARFLLEDTFLREGVPMPEVLGNYFMRLV